MTTKLPLLPPQVLKGSLHADGTRERIHPADVHGRFARARTVVFVVLILIWAALPWIRIRGNPAIFLDVADRKFFLFGATFNAQDTYLAFFLLTGVGFALVYVTALLGRVWCGWMCPQTVFLDGVFRRIERLIEGNRDVRMRRMRAPLSWDKVWRKAVLHLAFFTAAFGIAHIILSYFVTLPGMVHMIHGPPADHPEAFAWAAGVTVVLYGNFAFFREQLCLAICPYGRLQSILIDQESMVIGYDAKRGEPRGKASNKEAGDCVDCNRCVNVCPTAIDIRNGLQIDCVACTACIDACDDVMDRLGRERGLIRYTSLSRLAGSAGRVLRGRVLLYTALAAIGLSVAIVVSSKRTTFEANVLRLPGAPYVKDGDVVRDSFEIHLVNKTNVGTTYHIEGEPAADATFVIPISDAHVAPLSDVRIPVFVSMPRAKYTHDFDIRVKVGHAEESKTVTARFLGVR